MQDTADEIEAKLEDRLSESAMPVVATKLFRPAALDAQRIRWHGDIVLAQPMSFAFLALLAAGLAAAVLLFAIFGTYTKRTTVAGQVVPSSGLVKMYVSQPGTVVEVRAVEGQQVRKGDVLLVLSGERTSSTRGATQGAISEQVRLRQQSLQVQLGKTERLARMEAAALEQRLATLQQELVGLQTMIEGQGTRVALAQQGADRYRDLAAQGYVTQDQALQKQAELIDQQSRAEGLARERVGALRTIRDAQAELASLPLRFETQIADLQRGIATSEQELSESEARRGLLVLASESGTVTAITVAAGQIVDGSKPLLAIVPHGASWQAQLYAPSRAVGFIKPGDVVRVRYQAFPFQKFGQYGGTVVSIATTALSSVELTGNNVFADRNVPGGEPLYRISVQLDSQSILAYGKPQPLQAGMLLDADVLRETRRLYEWVLEPLYSLSGKL